MVRSACDRRCAINGRETPMAANVGARSRATKSLRAVGRSRPVPHRIVRRGGGVPKRSQRVPQGPRCSDWESSEIRGLRAGEGKRGEGRDRFCREARHPSACGQSARGDAPSFCPLSLDSPREGGSPRLIPQPGMCADKRDVSKKRNGNRPKSAQSSTFPSFRKIGPSPAANIVEKKKESEKCKRKLSFGFS